MRLLLKPCDVQKGPLAALLEPSQSATDAATKVIATVGPASRAPGVLQAMLEAGLTALRFDLTFGALETHLAALDEAQKTAKTLNRLCAMCLDVRGNTCQVVQPFQVSDTGWTTFDREIAIAAGQKVVLSCRAHARLEVPTDSAEPVVLPVDQPALAQETQPGTSVDVGRYLTPDEDSAYVRLCVTAVTPDGDIECYARNDFKQRGHLTVTPTPRALPATREPQSPLQQPGRQPHAAAAHARNPSAPAAPGRPDPAAPHPLATTDLPDGGAAVATSSHSSDGDPDDAPPTASPLSAYDEVAIRAFHARGLLDFLIVGDVTRLEELRAVRVFLGSIGAGETKLLVKLKTARAVANVAQLAALADGVVLARGWLGVQVRPEKMAVLQKRVLARCNVLGKLVIVSRIVDTMDAVPRPTRAEATDIANSVLDGADGFLLGAQTTRGACAVAAVRVVVGICREAERCFAFERHFERTMALLREQQHQQDAGDDTSACGGRVRPAGSFFFAPSRVASAENLTAYASSDDQGASTSASSSLAAPLAAPVAAQAVASSRAAAGSLAAAAPFHAAGAAPPFAPPPPPPPRASMADAYSRVAVAAGGRSPLGGGPPLARRGRGGGVPFGGGPPALRPQLSDVMELSIEASPSVMAPILDGSEDPVAAAAAAAAVRASLPAAATLPPYAAGAASRSAESAALPVPPPPVAAAAPRRPTSAADLARTRGVMQPVASWGSLSHLTASPPASPSASALHLPALGRAASGADGAATPARRARRAPPLEDTSVLTSAEVAAATAVSLAASCGARLLLVVTDSGNTAAIVAKYKPRAPIVSLVVPTVLREGGTAWTVKGITTARQCNLLRGVRAFLAASTAGAPGGPHGGGAGGGLVAQGLQQALAAGLVSEADQAVVITQVGGRFQGPSVQLVRVGDVAGAALGRALSARREVLD